MKHLLLLLHPLMLLAGFTLGTAQVRADNAVSTPTATPATPPSNPAQFEIYLLAGQSNMAGRAPVGAEDATADPRVLVLNKEDKWVTQGEPIHYDKPKVNGVGPGLAFGKLMAEKKPGVTIGLVPCAFGGTTLSQWDPASKERTLYPPDSLYENAVRRTKIAMQSGTLKGILWHQGESDAGKTAVLYASRLAKIVAKWRADLNAPDVPFIAGEIGYYNYATHPFAKTVNDQIDSLPKIIPACAVVSADGLTEKGDHLHFNTASQHELARRYAEALLQLQGAQVPAKP